MNVSDITRSIAEQVSDAINLDVERGEFVNMDPGLAPWVGLYRRKIAYEPRTLGQHAGSWRGTLDLMFLAQEADLESGAACEDKLEELIDKVTQAVWDAPTFKAVVDMVKSVSVEYSFKHTDEATIHFQWAMIHIQAEVSTG